MTRVYWAVGAVLTLAALGASVALYPRLPESVPIHWNVHGQVDGYGAKAWAAFLMPGIMGGMLGLFALLPWLSPRRFEVGEFRPTYLYLMVVLLALLGYLHGLTLYAALGATDVGRFLVGGLFVFLALMGNVLGKVRRNFYIGVRTPWTLSSERVWTQTHRVAAWLFVLCGVVGLGLTLAGVPLFVPFALLMATAVAVVLYSLFLYKRLERRGEV